MAVLGAEAVGVDGAGAGAALTEVGGPSVGGVGAAIVVALVEHRGLAGQVGKRVVEVGELGSVAARAVRRPPRREAGDLGDGNWVIG